MTTQAPNILKRFKTFKSLGFSDQLSNSLVEKKLTLGKCKNLSIDELSKQYSLSIEDAKKIKKSVARDKINIDDLILLWSRAAGHCSKCGDNLLLDLKESGNIRIGEMAHILPDSIYGPRGDGELKGDVVYDNLILLCPTHHKEVDKAPKDYPVSYLKEMKKKQKKKVSSNINDKIDMASFLNLVEVENKKPDIKIFLEIFGSRHNFINNKLGKKIKQMFPDYGNYTIGITIKNIGDKLANRTTVNIRPKYDTFKENIYFSINNPISRNSTSSSRDISFSLEQINRSEIQKTKYFFYIGYQNYKKEELFDIINTLEFNYYLTCDSEVAQNGSIQISNFQE